MDPAIMSLLAGLFTGGMGALGGNEGKQKSSFSKTQQTGINDILNAIKGMKGNAQDVTQSPQFQQGNEFLNRLFNDQSFFENIEAPALRQFNEQIAPDIANRFASMGSGGSMGSTAFRNQINREGANLAQNLSAQRTGMQQAALPQTYAAAQQPFSNLMQMYQQALGQPMMNQYQPPSAGIGSMAAPFLQAASTYWGGQGGGGGGNMNYQSSSGGGSSSNQYPMTDYYDQQFRQQGAF